MEIQNQSQEVQEQQKIFYIEGFYTKVIRDMFCFFSQIFPKYIGRFSYFSKFDYHSIYHERQRKHYLHRASIERPVLYTVIFLRKQQQHSCWVNMSDFDLCYKLLDHGSETKIVIEYEEDSSFLVLKQNSNNKDENFKLQKIIKLQILAETQEQKDEISMSFIPDQQYPIMLEFTNGSPFKLVEKSFGCLKLDTLTFHFDFKDPDHCKLYIESEQNHNDEFFRVTLNKFKRIKGDYSVVKYNYSSKLVLPAFAFLTQETQISLRIDDNGTAFLINKDSKANIQTETIIPTNVDSTN